MFDIETYYSHSRFDPVFQAEFRAWTRDCYKSAFADLMQYGVPGLIILMSLGYLCE